MSSTAGSCAAAEGRATRCPGPAPAVFVMGPTAAGKTALAVALCRRFPFEIISVDASQVYRGMDIGTAKPQPDVLAACPHHLVDIRDPADTYSAAVFREDALAAMAGIRQRGRVPLLVGGTMLYFRVLEQGLSDLPVPDPGIRAELEDEARRLGWEALHRRLSALDPVSAARIGPRDRQRIQRALEIHRASGVLPSELARERQPVPLAEPISKLVVTPSDRALLHRRIEQRFADMLEAGLLDEVSHLLHGKRLDPALPAMRVVGYRQAAQYLTKKVGYSEMQVQAVAGTRQMAKRQLTWLRAMPGVTWIDSTRGDVADVVSRYLLRKIPQFAI